MPARLVLAGNAAWILAGAAGLGLVASSFMGWQLLRTTEALGECRGDRTSHIETAETNLAAVTAMRDRLAICLQEQGDDARAQARATQDWQRQIGKLTDIMAQERAARDKANDSDECEAWRQSAVCGPVADSLRDSAARTSGADRGDTGADSH